jgi:hypothetical protein
LPEREEQYRAERDQHARAINGADRCGFDPVGMHPGVVLCDPQKPWRALTYLTRFALLLRLARTRLAGSSRLRALFQPLVFVDGMNHLRPEIAIGVVALVDTLVQPFNCDMDGAWTVFLDQFTRCLVHPRGHRLKSYRP